MINYNLLNTWQVERIEFFLEFISYITPTDDSIIFKFAI